jgi:hypothetical protein
MTSSSNTTKADRQDKVVLLAKDLQEEWEDHHQTKTEVEGDLLEISEQG